MRDFRDAKAMARTLREALAARHVTIGASEALELVARMLGQRDWNTLSAAIETARRREAAWTRLEGVYARKERVTGSVIGRVRAPQGLNCNGGPTGGGGPRRDGRVVPSGRPPLRGTGERDDQPV
jgi:hypothetical protein